MALSLGKLLGASILGVSSDRYGRKTIYTLGIVMFVVTGPASAYVPWYWAFVVLRLLTGISFSATQFSSLTTCKFFFLYILWLKNSRVERNEKVEEKIFFFEN